MYGTATIIRGCGSILHAYNVMKATQLTFASTTIGIIVKILLSDIEAECQDDYMKIRIGFNGSFAGLLYSAGN